MMENLKEVILANRTLLAMARELNTRAGENIFPVQGRKELAELFTVALGGARQVAEIRNLSALLLPALDEHLVAEVLRLCPDTVKVCGRDMKVDYRSGDNPRVMIDFRGDASREWQKIPNDGIRLPDGREVSMFSVVEGYGYYIEAMSSQFKAKARECLNQGLWEKWQKPELPQPTDSVSPIVEAEYGRCVVTNVSLVAFGAVNYDSWHRSWKSYWSRDRVEVERILAEAKDKFIEAREKVARDALKKRVVELYSAHSHNRELTEEIRTRLYNTYYGYSGGATTVSEIEEFIAEVEVAVATIKERKAEAERVKYEAEARRDVVNVAIGGMGYAEAHIWVPSGSGDVAYVLAGKTSKLGNFVVSPNAGDMTFCGPYCFGDSKYRAWVPFKLSVRSKAQDFASSGNIKWELTLFVPKGLLPPGVYGVGSDEQGQFFFPVIHHNSEWDEVIPKLDAIRKIRPIKESTVPSNTRAVPTAPASMASLAMLAAKFGR